MHKEQSTAGLVHEAPESAFYIPTTLSATRPRRTLKHGDCFVVLDSHGDLGGPYRLLVDEAWKVLAVVEEGHQPHGSKLQRNREVASHLTTRTGARG